MPCRRHATVVPSSSSRPSPEMSTQIKIADSTVQSDSRRSLLSWMGSSKYRDDDLTKRNIQTPPRRLRKGLISQNFWTGWCLFCLLKPERSALRWRALNMCFVYRADWTSDCTFLVSAFVNTSQVSTSSAG